MAHFSASGDSIASLLIVVRIGFEPLCFLSRLFVIDSHALYLLKTNPIYWKLHS